VTRELPQDDYIEAVTVALEAAGLPVKDIRTDDSETRGTYCYLNAVIELDLYGTDFEKKWPHGLLLIWEWHTGIEDGEPERGPEWLFAELNENGSCWYPTSLPVYGYASPAAVAEAARKVITREIRPTSFDGGPSTWQGAPIGDTWDRHTELNDACETWGTVGH
jgi:hypothetical protein